MYRSLPEILRTCRDTQNVQVSDGCLHGQQLPVTPAKWLPKMMPAGHTMNTQPLEMQCIYEEEILRHVRSTNVYCMGGSIIITCMLIAHIFKPKALKHANS